MSRVSVNMKLKKSGFPSGMYSLPGSISIVVFHGSGKKKPAGPKVIAPLGQGPVIQGLTDNLVVFYYQAPRGTAPDYRHRWISCRCPQRPPLLRVYSGEKPQEVQSDSDFCLTTCNCRSGSLLCSASNVRCILRVNVCIKKRLPFSL